MGKVTVGEFGASKVYDFSLAVLLLTLGGFALALGHYTVLAADIFNSLLLACGLAHLLIALGIIKNDVTEAIAEYFSIILIVINLVLSLAGRVTRTDSWSYATFALILIILKLRATAYDRKSNPSSGDLRQDS